MLGAVRMTTDTGATASNWRTLLLVDAVIGLGVASAGVWIASSGYAFVGVVFIAMGMGYANMVARRFARWKRIRAEAGLG